jgi:hypothetical protein
MVNQLPLHIGGNYLSWSRSWQPGTSGSVSCTRHDHTRDIRQNIPGRDMGGRHLVMMTDQSSDSLNI